MPHTQAKKRGRPFGPNGIAIQEQLKKDRLEEERGAIVLELTRSAKKYWQQIASELERYGYTFAELKPLFKNFMPLIYDSHEEDGNKFRNYSSGMGFVDRCMMGEAALTK